MRTKIKIVFIFSLVLLHAGCLSRKAQLANFQTGEVLKARFTDSPFTNGKITVTMPDGEVLKGPYSAIREHDSFTFRSGTVSANTDVAARTSYTSEAQGQLGNAHLHGESNGQIDTAARINTTAHTTEQSRTVGGTGRAYALLSSTKPGSKLMMEVIVTYGVLSGHGWGEARCNDGRAYRVTF